MTPKSIAGLVLAFLIVGLFGLYMSKHELTAVAGFVFGGGLLFAGLLIDPAEFRSVLTLFKRGGP